MNKKKSKINIIIIVIIALLIATFVLIRFEVNPFSYFTGGETSGGNSNNIISSNYNGVYRYKESLDKTYKLYSTCTLSYYDYYIVILNNNYYRYKSSCNGTFFLDEGRTKSLNIDKTLEQNTVITFDGKKYLKTDLINTIKVNNYVYDFRKKTIAYQAENYKILLKDAYSNGNKFNIEKGSLNSNNASFAFSFNILDNNHYNLKLLNNNKQVVYTYNTDNLNNLPLFRGFGTSLSVIEPYESSTKYSYTLRRLTLDGFVYDLKSKFPITIDDDLLDYNDSIFIKFSPTENAFIMLIGNNKKFCEINSNSKEVAYYIFHIKYDYVKKDFANPKFIKKVYKNEGCKFVSELMEE